LISTTVYYKTVYRIVTLQSPILQ